MESVLIATEQDMKSRARDLEAMRKQDEENLEDTKKNKGFTQIYPRGWKRVVELAKENPKAFELYAFFAENLDPSCGAVVCDQHFLAEQMNVSVRTVQRWLKFLETRDALIRIPVAGRVCAYALDPYEVWKGYDNSKEYAAFTTKTLVNKDGDIKRRIMSMHKKNCRK